MKNTVLPLLLVCSFLFISCQPTKVIADTSCPGYKSADFSRSDIPAGGIGIMPVLGGDDKEQYRRPMGNEITRAMRDVFGEGQVKTPAEVISILNGENLADEYAQAINLYQTSGIIPKDLLHQIGDALGVEYLLYVRLLGESDIGYQDWGYYGHKRTEVFELYAQSQVWSTKLGDVVWEGKGGCAVLASHSVDIIEKTADGIANVVGNDMNDGPCESKKEVLDSATKAYEKTLYTIVGVSLVVLLSPLLLLL